MQKGLIATHTELTKVVAASGQVIVQMDVSVSEKDLVAIKELVVSLGETFTPFPYEAVTTSAHAERQFVVKQRFFEEKKTRADCQLSAFKLAAFVAVQGCCAYVAGTDVHVLADNAADKVKVKTLLRADDVWSKYLPVADWAQLGDDVPTAWSEGTVFKPKTTATPVVPTSGLAGDEEYVVVKARTPFPKDVEKMVNAIEPGLVFAFVKSANLAYAKVKIDESRTEQRHVIHGRVLFVRRAKDWAADNTV
jgi:hypothetical protein